jgi:hypothetical protein
MYAVYKYIVIIVICEEMNTDRAQKLYASESRQDLYR